MADFLIHDPGDAGSIDSFFYRLNQSEPWQGAERLPGGGDRLFGGVLKTGVLTVGEIMALTTVSGGVLDAQKSNAGITVEGGRATIGKIIGTVFARNDGVVSASSVEGHVLASDGARVTVGGVAEGDVSVRDDAIVNIAGRILGSVSMVGGELRVRDIAVPKQDDLPGSGIGIGGEAELTARSLSYNDIDGSLTSVTSGATLKLQSFNFNKALAENNHIEIIGGGEMTLAGALLMGRAGSIDTVSIDDPGSHLKIGGLLTIGDNGRGFMDIGFGATVDAGRVVMAARTFAGGASGLNVAQNFDGKFSTFNCESLEVGVRGPAVVFIGGGGIVNADTLRIGTGRGSDGVVQLSGRATGLTNWHSQLNVTGDITVGEHGLGRLDVSAGAVAKAQDVIVAANSESGSERNPSTIEVDDASLQIRNLTLGKHGYGIALVHQEDGRLRANAVNIGERGEMTALRDGAALIRTGIVIDAAIGAAPQLRTDFGARIVVGSNNLGGTDPGSITVASGGVIRGTGMIYAPTVDVAGTIRAQGGTLQVDGTLTGTGTAQIASNSTLDCQYVTDLDIDFAGARGTLELDTVAVYDGTVSGFAFGDTIVVSGKQIASHRWTQSANGSTLVLRDASNNVYRLDFDERINTKLTLVFAGGDTTLAFTSGNGAAGADTLLGTAFADTIAGRGGNDVIAGAAGADVMAGGAGRDIFDFDALRDSGVRPAQRDTISDFDAGSRQTFADRIDLRNIDAKSGIADNQAFTFIGTDAFDRGTKGELRVSHSGNATIVSGEVTGDAVADFAIALSGRIPLANFAANDFLL